MNKRTIGIFFFSAVLCVIAIFFDFHPDIYEDPGEGCPEFLLDFSPGEHIKCSGKIFLGEQWISPKRIGDKGLEDTQFRDGLVHVDFSRTKFEELMVEGVNLKHISFDGAKMPGVYFGDIVFKNVTFVGAKLRKAHFLGTKWKADPVELLLVGYTKMKMESVSFVSANLVQARFEGFEFDESVSFRDANLSEASFIGGFAQGADFSYAYMHGVFFRDADLSQANFNRADLSNAVMKGVNLRYANLSDAKLVDADLSKADLRGAKVSRNTSFKGANLSGAKIDKEALRRGYYKGAVRNGKIL